MPKGHPFLSSFVSQYGKIHSLLSIATGKNYLQTNLVGEFLEDGDTIS